MRQSPHSAPHSQRARRRTKRPRIRLTPVMPTYLLLLLIQGGCYYSFDPMTGEYPLVVREKSSGKRIDDFLVVLRSRKSNVALTTWCIGHHWKYGERTEWVKLRRMNSGQIFSLPAARYPALPVGLLLIIREHRQSYSVAKRGYVPCRPVLDENRYRGPHHTHDPVTWELEPFSPATYAGAVGWASEMFEEVLPCLKADDPDARELLGILREQLEEVLEKCRTGEDDQAKSYAASARMMLTGVYYCLAEPDALAELNRKYPRPPPPAKPARPPAEAVDTPEVAKAIADLKSADPNQRKSAAELLGRLRAANAVTALIEALPERCEPQSEDRSVELANMLATQAVIHALGKIGDQRAVEPLIALMNKPPYAIFYSRYNLTYTSDIVKVLGEIGGPQAVDALIRIVDINDHYHLGRAASALAETGDPRAVKPIIRVLRTADTTGRSSAVRALWYLRPESAVEPLIDVLEDYDRPTRVRAHDALYEITGMYLGPEPNAWRKWWRDQQRQKRSQQ